MTATFKKLVANSFSRNFRSIAEVVERELVDPGDGEVLVKNHFGGVNASDINISGLETDEATLEALLAVDRDAWSEEMEQIREYLQSYGDRIPAQMITELEIVVAELG